MPGSSRSNDNGRSLEYFVTLALSTVRGCKLTSRTVEFQVRDKRTSAGINPSLKSAFDKASKIIRPCGISEIRLTSGQRFVVDRHADSDPGVADLTVSQGSQTLAVSIKHNHDALSHSRPYSLADAMGLAGTSFESDHRDRLDIATNSFRNAAGGASTFPSVPAAKLNLYRDVCRECAKTVNRAGNRKVAVSTLFEFLVGGEFKKVIVKTHPSSGSLIAVSVDDYSKWKSPSSVVASVNNRPRSSSLVLAFDNGWVIDLRIKNASTTIQPTGQVSLKFDAQKAAGTLPPLLKLF